MDLNPGQTLGQYQIVQKIGEGGMGAVYKADQPSIPRSVVIKVLGSSLADQPEALDRFRRELDMITRLEHPHILPVYDFGEVNSNPYIVMRFMSGGSLQERLQAAAFGRVEALRLLDQVALALDFAHDHGIIHRDLKPANILLDEAANAYLADFGLAKTMSGTQDLTATGSTLGSPAYMSPEQARGQKLDRRSDIYSFAVLIYRVLSGRLPFEAKTAWEFITKHISEEPVPIRRYAPDLPPAVEAVLGTGLAKDPRSRPERATELMTSLKTALSASPGSPYTQQDSLAVSSTPASTSSPRGTFVSPTIQTGPGDAVPRPIARTRRLPILIGIAVAVVLTVGAIVAGALYFGGASLREDKLSTFAVGDEPRALLFDGEALWVANFFDNSLTKLAVSACDSSPDQCGQTLGTFQVDDLPVALAFDGDTLWVASSLQRSLSVVDPASGEVLLRYQLPHVPTALIWANSYLWSASAIAGTVTQVSSDGHVLDDIQVGEGTLGLAFDGRWLWAISKEAKSLVRIDPGNTQALENFQLEDSPLAIAFGNNSLWVGLGELGQVIQIDPVNPGSVVRRVDLGSPPVALLYDREELWAVSPEAGKVFRIDPINAEVIGTIAVTGYPVSLQSTTCGVGCRDLWTANQADDSVSRIQIK